MFDDFEFEDKFNPWTVTSLDDFLFYCCPECDHKSITKGVFIEHAVNNHPKSQDVIDSLESKVNLTSIKTENENNKTVENQRMQSNNSTSNNINEDIDETEPELDDQLGEVTKEETYDPTKIDTNESENDLTDEYNSTDSMTSYSLDGNDHSMETDTKESEAEFTASNSINEDFNEVLQVTSNDSDESVLIERSKLILQLKKVEVALPKLNDNIIRKYTKGTEDLLFEKDPDYTSQDQDSDSGDKTKLIEATYKAIECADCGQPFESNADYKKHYYGVHLKKHNL